MIEIIIFPFFIVNGALTGAFNEQVVVWYNFDDILGYRLYTIPIEDVFYAYQMILVNLFFYIKLLFVLKDICNWFDKIIP